MLKRFLGGAGNAAKAGGGLLVGTLASPLKKISAQNDHLANLAMLSKLDREASSLNIGVQENARRTLENIAIANDMRVEDLRNMGKDYRTIKIVRER